MATRLIAAVLVAATTFVCVPARAQQDAPRLADPNNRITRPDLSGLLRLRFMTTLDFPPFNFPDPQRRPTGFNVELARAICRELDIEAKCEIQAMPWEELEPALDGLRGEAIIAGHGITTQLRAARSVSQPYFRFPARFAANRDFTPGNENMTALTRGKRVAVVVGSAHAAMLKAWFPDAVPRELTDVTATYKALLNGTADFIFGDGVALSFWLASPNAANCCKFVSGPYMSDKYLGHGMVVVMRRDSAPIMKAIDAALNTLEANGVYQEIFTRYFPLNPFAGEANGASLAPGEGKAERPEQPG